jgi:hypothetical protein
MYSGHTLHTLGAQGIIRQGTVDCVCVKTRMYSLTVGLGWTERTADRREGGDEGWIRESTHGSAAFAPHTRRQAKGPGIGLDQ